MNCFKVKEIVNGNTIRVSPEWTIICDGEEIADDILQITGFNTTKDDQIAKFRLEILILDKEVEIVEPQLLSQNLPTDAKISCKVILERTNITYYFPEYTNILV